MRDHELYSNHSCFRFSGFRTVTEIFVHLLQKKLQNIAFKNSKILNRTQNIILILPQHFPQNSIIIRR